MRKTVYSLVSVMLFFFVSCGGGGSNDPVIEPSGGIHGVTAIEMSQTSATIHLKEELKLSVKCSPADVNSYNIDWATSDEKVVEIKTKTDSCITVIGKAAGTATITAKVNGLSATCQVTVSNSTDGDNASLAGTAWKVVAVSSSGSDSDWEDFKGSIATLKSDGNIVFTPTNDWSYAKWSLTDNVLKFTVGEGEPDDCIVGNITFNGNKATWTCYWEDADGKWSGKDDPEAQAIISLEKQ